MLTRRAFFSGALAALLAPRDLLPEPTRRLWALGAMPDRDRLWATLRGRRAVPFVDGQGRVIVQYVLTESLQVHVDPTPLDGVYRITIPPVYADEVDIHVNAPESMTSLTRVFSGNRERAVLVPLFSRDGIHPYRG